MRSRPLQLLVVMLAAYGLVYFHRVMTGVMKAEMVSFAEYYGVDPTYMLAFFPAAYFYSYALAQLFMGGFVDTYGVKRAGAAMLTAMGLSTLMMVLPSATALMAGRALVGLSAAVVFVAAQRVASLYYGTKSQATITSLLLMVGNISGLLATYPLRLFLRSFGVAALLATLSGLALAMSLAVFALAADTGIKRAAGAGAAWKKMANIAKDGHAWATAVGAVASYGVGTAFQAAWGQDYLERAMGLDEVSASVYLMVLAASFVVSAPLVGYLSDKVIGRRKPVLLAATAVSAASWGVLLLASALKSAVVALVGLIGLGISMGLHIVAPPMAKEPYGADFSATATSFFNLVLFTGIAVLQNTEPFIGPVANSALSLFTALVGLALVKALAKETLRA